MWSLHRNEGSTAIGRSSEGNNVVFSVPRSCFTTRSVLLGRSPHVRVPMVWDTCADDAQRAPYPLGQASRNLLRFHSCITFEAGVRTGSVQVSVGTTRTQFYADLRGVKGFADVSVGCGRRLLIAAERDHILSLSNRGESDQEVSVINTDVNYRRGAPCPVGPQAS